MKKLITFFLVLLFSTLSFSNNSFDFISILGENLIESDQVELQIEIDGQPHLKMALNPQQIILKDINLSTKPKTVSLIMKKLNGFFPWDCDKKVYEYSTQEGELVTLRAAIQTTPSGERCQFLMGRLSNHKN